jgi:hypothetical protein
MRYKNVKYTVNEISFFKDIANGIAKLLLIFSLKMAL